MTSVTSSTVHPASGFGVHSVGDGVVEDQFIGSVDQDTGGGHGAFLPFRGWRPNTKREKVCWRAHEGTKWSNEGRWRGCCVLAIFPCGCQIVGFLGGDEKNVTYVWVWSAAGCGSYKSPPRGDGTGFHINWKQNESLWKGSHYNLLPAAQDKREATEAEERGAGGLGDW